jgi:hypothetical protein
MLSYFIKKNLKIIHFRTYSHSYPNLVTGSPVMMSSRISHGRSSNSILFTNMGNQFLFPTCAILKLFFFFFVWIIWIMIRLFFFFLNCLDQHKIKMKTISVFIFLHVYTKKEEKKFKLITSTS